MHAEVRDTTHIELVATIYSFEKCEIQDDDEQEMKMIFFFS